MNYSQNSTKDYGFDLSKEGEIGALLIKASKFNNLDSTIFYSQKALGLSLIKKDTSLVSSSYITLGLGYFYKQDFENGTIIANKCLDYLKNIDLPGFKMMGNKIIAASYRRKKDFNNAIKYYEKAITYAKKPEDKMFTKINLGTLYLEHKNGTPELAKGILLEVLAYHVANPNILSTKTLYAMFEGLSLTSSSAKEAIKYADSSVVYAKKDGIKSMRYIVALSSKARTLFLNKKYNEALKFYKKSLFLSKEVNYTHSILENYTQLARVYGTIENYDYSLKYIDSLESFCKKNNVDLSVGINEILDMKIAIYEALDDFKNANINLKKKHVYLDSVNKQKHNNAYLEYGRKYESEIKAQENKILKQEISIKELTLLKEARYKSYLYLVLFLTLLLLLYGNYRYRKNVRTKNVLTEKNTIIELQKEDLQKALGYSKQVNDKLELANKTKEKLFGVIAHDLINPFNTVIGYTNLLLEDFEYFTEEEKIEIVKVINEASKKNHILVKNLLDWSRSQQNRIVVKNEELTINSLIDNAITPYLEYAKKKNIKIIYDFEFTHLYADQNILKTVIGNLFFNAVKFTKANHNIFISSKITNEIKTIEIKDEGVGMCKEKLKTLFHLNTSNTTKGTNNEKGSGLGLIISKEFLELAGGNLKIQSKANFGTSVSLEFA
ncbi:tetratricopeptide repeat-containing sensor histidine kinase [Polaribacter sp. Z022]|uniref:tetratricopeptide repeat-containing sensor histidine kinase n=1 Tax=Polaribacter sp. Z022 TaxID=2927125 RepID=UPI00201FFBA4|nr:tetratricopeptide repeat-containing sensor histidine kinase [Polaribacter sp. Z022]MCL7753308.1 tetratricopeptide repeat-containing sensor histidine kinase [Polaribacter sp. Z022]